jgi:DDE superfamily endonuclease
VLGVDVSNWLRPDAATSSQRLFCHTYGRGRGQAQMIPGWPYSLVAALEPGRSSWCALLDAVRLGPDDDATAVAAAQLRAVVGRLIATGHHNLHDPDIWIVGDSGYDGARMAYLLADLPVRLLVRLRSDRVLCFPPSAQSRTGRPARHGAEFRLADPTSWPEPEHTTVTATSRYGTATAHAWTRLHPRLTHRGAWAAHPGDPPIIEATVILLRVEHLPGDASPKPLWLWAAGGAASTELIDRLWQAFLRRFDLEHTFRFLKQTLGWTTPNLRCPQAADRWTWLVLIAHAQLRLARDLTADLRRPWERPAPPGRLTPARVRRGFRNIRPKISLPAGAPKPSHPGPGRPPGSKNKHRAHHHHVGKTATSTPRPSPQTPSG